LRLILGLFFFALLISCAGQQTLGQMRGPGQVQPDIVGNCFIYHLRTLDEYVPAGTNFKRDVCGSPRGWSPATHAYVFLFPAINSLYNAEKAFCGSYGCTSAGKDMRLVLVGDPLPNAYIASETPRDVTLVVTTTLVDFVQRNGHALMNDLLEDPQLAPQGFDAWVASLRALGGKSCSLPVKWNTTSLSPKIGEDTVLRLAGMTYQFLFAHEIAHLRTNRTCGYQNNPALSTEKNSQGIELACDKIAFETLAKADLVIPVFTVATFMGWQHYLTLRRPRLMADYPGGQLKFKESFPALGFKERSQALVGAWERACSGGRATPMCQMKNEILKTANKIINSAPPSECVP
jgi:hypothetical protein